LAADRWVFATIETVMVGLDTSYALRKMGVGYDCFADSVRCVWSQVLVEALCDDCGVEAGAPSAEAQAAGVDVHAHIKREAGCPRCDGRGTKGVVAISDVTLLPDELREGVRSALVKGIEFPLRGENRASALQQARAFLGRGTIGINTFQDLVRRNPILRSQGALERAELQLNMLTALANRTLAGVIVVGADQQVRFANACARNTLVRTTDLCIEDRRLTPAPTVARAFAAGLAAAVADEPRATRLALNVDGGDSRNVFIAPLPSAWNMHQEGQRLALIVLGGARSAEILPNARDLRQYFDLTPAESNVALLLCAGLVPKGIARKLNVSLPTVRSHLRALLDKTGTARQSELLSLLSSLPSTTATHSH
jgi:DNA-binding CsgD family transcriptional regulator